jgi:pyrimidine-nucleoside phosphorylase
MVEIGKNAGKKVLAMVTEMSTPLGNAIGNSLEVIEAIETLNGNGPKDFTDICIALASNILYLAGRGTLEECEEMAKGAITSKKALETFAKSVKMHGGDESLIYDTSKFEKASCEFKVLAPDSGYIEEVDTEGYGVASLLLGAGRNKKEDKIDYLAGIILNKKTGDFVQKGEVIATMYSSNESLFDSAVKKFLASTKIGSNKPKTQKLIHSIIK